MASDFGLLSQADEDALHKARLLNVEEKPFKRITKRLLGPNALIAAPLRLPLTPPPEQDDADQDGQAAQTQRQKQLESRRQWREDALLDFAAYESSIIRIQFVLSSNIKERNRYAAEKVKIVNAAQTVGDNITELRHQLEVAQATLALRKEYDRLADKILGNPSLRPRDEQATNIEKLQTEIAELRRESQDYAQTWAERRAQFGRIIDEGLQLRRLIRDEKEEVERREGMEGEGQEEGEDDQKGKSSGANTPRPENAGHNDSGETSDPDSASRSNTANTDKTSPLKHIIGTEDEAQQPASKPQENEDMAEDGEVESEQDGTASEDSQERRGSRDRGAEQMAESMDTS